jgi:anti-anti-sigma regulatory factor
MKLALRQEDGCSILQIQGNVDVHNFAVLKAGLSKLLQNGKNRIVLEIQDSKDLSGEVIRELAILDVFARELSGKLVIVSPSQDLKEKVLAFAKPPVVGILQSLPKALDYLKGLDGEPGEESGGSPEEMKAQLEEKTRRAAALEAQLKLVDPTAVQRLRQENAELKSKVALLEGQVNELASLRRQPVDGGGFLEKCEALEETVRKLSAAKTAAAK